MSRPAHLRVHPEGADVTWMGRRACYDVPAAVFFPEYEYAALVVEAKKFCDSCDVTGQCLAYAMATREPFGVWGGHTTAERRRLRRSHMEAMRCRTPPAGRSTPPCPESLKVSPNATDAEDA